MALGPVAQADHTHVYRLPSSEVAVKIHPQNSMISDSDTIDGLVLSFSEKCWIELYWLVSTEYSVLGLKL